MFIDIKYNIINPLVTRFFISNKNNKHSSNNTKYKEYKTKKNFHFHSSSIDFFFNVFLQFLLMHPDQKNEMQAFHSALILEFVFYFLRQMVKDEPRKWTVLAICATICVVMLHAVENVCGRSIIVPEITVPFSNMSFKFGRQQLLIR